MIPNEILRVLEGYQQMIDVEYALTTIANSPRLKRLRHQKCHLMQTLNIWMNNDGVYVRCLNPFTTVAIASTYINTFNSLSHLEQTSTLKKSTSES